jgi:hypothetical protein
MKIEHGNDIAHHFKFVECEELRAIFMEELYLHLKEVVVKNHLDWLYNKEDIFSYKFLIYVDKTLHYYDKNKCNFVTFFKRYTGLRMLKIFRIEQPLSLPEFLKEGQSVGRRVHDCMEKVLSEFDLDQYTRKIIYLKLEGWTYKDIADRLGITRSTAHYIYQKGVKICQEQLN